MPSPSLSGPSLRRRIVRRWAWLRNGVSRSERVCHNTSDRVLLTFDDGGPAGHVEEILTVLADQGVRAAFFPTGEWAASHGALIQKIRGSGHWVGNHTGSHADLRRLPEADIEREILAGVQSALLRPPFGRVNRRARRVAERLGYRIAYWDIDPRDWLPTTARDPVMSIVPELHPGACVLLHMNGTQRVELEQLIDEVRRAGLDLCRDGTELAL